MESLPLAAHLRSLANPVGGPLGDRPVTESSEKSQGVGEPSFGEHLREQIDEVNDLQLEADQSIDDLVTGRSDDIHATMIALQKADISFRLLMSVRNKLMDAYDEVMRMQI
jgi:flagellar hook-basal body complex protein FliE